MPAEDNRLPREYVSALMAHRGELVIKEKFPVRPKLAMLSPRFLSEIDAIHGLEHPEPDLCLRSGSSAALGRQV